MLVYFGTWFGDARSLIYFFSPLYEHGRLQPEQDYLYLF